MKGPKPVVETNLIRKSFNISIKQVVFGCILPIFCDDLRIIYSPFVPSLHVQGQLYLTHYTVTSSQLGAQTPRGLRICMSVTPVKSHTVGPFKFTLLFACEHDCKS